MILWKICLVALVVLVREVVAEVNNWVTSNAPNACWNGVASDASGSFMVGLVCSNGGIYLSYDSGITWTQSNAPLLNWYRVAVSETGTFIVAVVSEGYIFYSINQGTTWNQASGAPLASWSGVSCSSTGQYCVAVIWTGIIYYSSNYGQTWTASNNAKSINWSSVSMTSNGQNAFASIGYPGSAGQIYTTNNYGKTWNVLSGTPTQAWVWVTCSTNGNNLVAASYGGGIYYSKNSGSTWTASSAPSGNWFGLSGDQTGQYIAAIIGCDGVCSGQVYLSDDYGVSFTLSNAGTYSYSALAMNGNGSTIAASIYQGSILIGTVSDIVTDDDSIQQKNSTADPSTNTDEYAAVGGTGGFVGILIAGVFVMAGIVSAILYHYFFASIFSKASEPPRSPELVNDAVNNPVAFSRGGSGTGNVELQSDQLVLNRI